jgi:hypothetical protein
MSPPVPGDVEPAVPRLHRVWFTLGVLAGLFPAIAGPLAPATLDKVFSWVEIPELHARFIGGIYLFAVVYTFGCLIARRPWQTADAHWAIVIFTGLIGYLNLVNLDAFDFSLVAPKVWFAIYVVFPIAGVPIALAARRRSTEPPAGGVPMPAWARVVLVAQAIVFAVVGVVLLVARQDAAREWPWEAAPGLVQFYSAAFLVFGFLSWRASTMRTWRSFATLVVPFAALGVSTVVTSLGRADLFDVGAAATWAWFGFFGVVSCSSLAMLATMVRDRQFTTG